MSHSEEFDDNETGSDETKGEANRRSFLSAFPSMLMAFGLTGGYGMFVSLAVRFLFPARPLEKRLMFVGEISSF